MDDIVSFGYWVRRRRKALDLTQTRLARQVGCSLVMIRKIEGDERRPSLQMAKLLADRLLIPEAERDHFLRMAHGEFIAAMPSLLEAVPSAKFWQEPDGSRLGEEPPFVARERELSELAGVLRTVRTGQGQILFVIGGAGRGKTMLVQEFTRRAQAAAPDLIAVSGHCNAHTGLGDPYLPFREVLTMLTGDVEAKLAAGLIAPAQARRLWELMPLTVPALVKQSPDLIGAFVPAEALLKRAATFASPGVPWFKQLITKIASEPSPGLEQKQILAQYTALLKIAAARHPLLLILEDLHWVDASSNALLFHLSREVGNDRILIVGTYRPDEVALNRGEVRHPLAQTIGELKRRHGDIWLDLGKLAPAEGQQFVEAYLDTQPNRLGRAFREALFRRTGGHALFTVELLRELQERGDLRQDAEGYWVDAVAIDWAKVPARVEGVIETRLSRLSAELQAILTIASVEGEIFTAEVVARVQQLNERGLIQQLSRELDKQHRLVTAQALNRVGQQRLSFYRFRHYLFQHYLYHHLAEAERVYFHEAVGHELERLYGEQTEEVAVELARHFEAAGLIAEAVHYLHQAGSRAVRLSANEEAVGHFNRALALLQTLPESPERNRQELALQIALGAPLTITKGYSSPELEQTSNRALKLYQAVSAQGSVQVVEDILQLFEVLYGLWSLKLVRAELVPARELAQQMLDLAQRQSDSLLLMPAHWLVGNTLFWLGEFALAQEHFEQGMALYNPQHHRSHVLLFGQDQGVVCLSFQAWNLWELGYPDQALQRSLDALTLAEALAHPHSLVYATVFAAHLRLRRREWQAVQQQAERGIALSTEYGIHYWPSEAMGPLGKVLAEQGQVEEGIVVIRQGLAAWQVQGVEVCLPYMLALLAEVYGQAGRVEAGLNAVTEALAVVEKTAEHLSEPELYRLRGELLLNASPEGRGMKDEVVAETCFWQAIKIAHRQGAKSLELRAVMSLSRLWQRQGKKEEARQLLTETYGWFTEGFDTADLKEAQTLLQTLT
ncbi:MAG: AAA family ATPase [Anaerolineae bacterium]